VVRSNAKGTGGAPGADGRLSHVDRRDALLDTAAALLEDGGGSAVTMEAVAAHAGVSRPLVYKHFTNRDDLMVALFTRESDAFDTEVAEALRAADGLEAVIRTSAEAIIDGFARRRRVLRPLLYGESMNAGLREAQHERTLRNHGWYRDMVVAERGVPPEVADTAITVLFGGLVALISASRARLQGDERQLLVDTYVAMVMGGLDRLADADRPDRPG
jgi:AcrR family transcriptional regulator